MFEPRCEVCGKPAVIHETAVEEGIAIARHLCHEHGEAVWQASAPPGGDADAQAAQLHALKEYWDGLSEVEKRQLAHQYHLSRLCRRGT